MRVPEKSSAQHPAEVCQCLRRVLASADQHRTTQRLLLLLLNKQYPAYQLSPSLRNK